MCGKKSHSSWANWARLFNNFFLIIFLTKKWLNTEACNYTACVIKLHNFRLEHSIIDRKNPIYRQESKMSRHRYKDGYNTPYVYVFVLKNFFFYCLHKTFLLLSCEVKEWKRSTESKYWKRSDRNKIQTKTQKRSSFSYSV